MCVCAYLCPICFLSGQLFSQSLKDRPNVVFTKEGSALDDDSYLGYSVTVGNFGDREGGGAAVGMPRGAGLLGKVLLYTWNLTNHLNLTGEQLGAYFGYALCVSDLDGDRRDDLIVGAPLYTDLSNKDGKYETGRIYIFYQTRDFDRRFRSFDLRDGKNSRSRFGLSLTSLGDINRDGYGDIAVGAPYDGPQGKGAVYIYHGSSKGIMEKASQVILAEDVFSTLSTFGFSVAGGMDLDENQYPDLVVGAYEADTAVYLSGSKVTCTEVNACLKYSGIGVDRRLDFEIQFALDAKKPKNPRMFFMDGGRNVRNFTQRLDKDSHVCRNFTVYIKSGIRDKLTPLDVEMHYSLRTEAQPPGRRRVPRSLVPVLDQSKETVRRDSISIQKNCGRDNICIPDLSLSVLPSVERYLLGSGNRLELDVIVENRGEDSFETMFTMNVPGGVHYVKVERLESADKDVLCSAPSFSNNRTLKCDLGNPLPQNRIVRFKVHLMPDLVEVKDPRYEFNINVTSTNPEEESTTRDNVMKLSIPIWIDAEFELTGGSTTHQGGRGHGGHGNWWSTLTEDERRRFEEERRIEEEEARRFGGGGGVHHESHYESSHGSYQGGRYGDSRSRGGTGSSYNASDSSSLGAAAYGRGSQEISSSGEVRHRASSSSVESGYSQSGAHRSGGTGSTNVEETEYRRGGGSTYGGSSTTVEESGSRRGGGSISYGGGSTTVEESGSHRGGGSITYRGGSTTVEESGSRRGGGSTYRGGSATVEESGSRRGGGSSTYGGGSTTYVDGEESSRGSGSSGTFRHYTDWSTGQGGSSDYDRSRGYSGSRDFTVSEETSDIPDNLGASYSRGGSREHHGQEVYGQESQFSKDLEESARGTGGLRHFVWAPDVPSGRQTGYGSSIGIETDGAGSRQHGGGIGFEESGRREYSGSWRGGQHEENSGDNVDYGSRRYNAGSGSSSHYSSSHSGHGTGDQRGGGSYHASSHYESSSSWSSDNENKLEDSGGTDAEAAEKLKLYRKYKRQSHGEALHKRHRRDIDDDLELKRATQCNVTKCAMMKCTMDGLTKGQEIEFEFRYRIWAQTLKAMGDNRPANVSSLLATRLTKLPYIGYPGEGSLKRTEVVTEVVPADAPLKPEIAPLWIVVLSACAGAIILLLLIYLLWKCGFFKRNRPSNAPEKEPLNRNGHYEPGDEQL
ncbi:hypothetical protein C0J52_13179 [Blattella germanica]|nr:hypothetical protein C0J52_13179 [Blattella germanica]